MPLIKKSRNSVWRIWRGPSKIGKKDKKKTVGFVVAANIRSDKLPVNISSDQIEIRLTEEIERVLLETIGE